MWFINLIFTCSSNWSSGGEACCNDSQVSLPGQSFMAPGGWAQYKLFLVALYGFCSLKTFHTSLEDQNKNWCPISPVPGPKDHSPLSSVNPQGYAVFMVCTYNDLPRGSQKVATFLHFAGPWHRERSPVHIRIHSTLPGGKQKVAH